MGFWDYLYIAVFVLLVLLIIYDMLIIAVNSQRMKKISRKAAVNKSIKLSIFWIILSAINSFVQFGQYRIALGENDAKDARLHFLEFIMWIIYGIAHFANIFINKHIYITPDGLFYKTRIKIQPKENYSYRVDGNILELYYKQSYTLVKYRIIENKDELIRACSHKICVRIFEQNFSEYKEKVRRHTGVWQGLSTQ